jgi:hypothetical protein
MSIQTVSVSEFDSVLSVVAVFNICLLLNRKCPAELQAGENFLIFEFKSANSEFFIAILNPTW